MNAARAAAKHWAEEMSKLGTSDNIYQLHLDLGADGELKPLTYGEAKRIVALAKRRGGLKAFLPNRCFDNASKLLLSDREQTLKYHEGFAATEGSELLMEHAWVSINGKVVDLTFRAALKNKVLTCGPQKPRQQPQRVRNQRVICLAGDVC